MALFDPSMFDPNYYNGMGSSGAGWLGLGIPNAQPGMGAFAQASPADMQQPPMQQQAPQDQGNPLSAIGGFLGNLFSPSQANAQPQGPGPLDRLSAGFQGFTNAGSPMQALGNLVGGITTGQRTDPAGLMQAQQQATYQALRSKGVPDADARAATLNPEILKTISGAYFDTKPTLQDTGTDPMTGQKTFAWSQPNKMTLTPAATPGAQPGSQNLGAFGQAVQSGIQGEALYDYLPPGMRNTVRSMIDGRQPPPSTVAMRSPATMALINAANSIDPNFDATTWRSRNTFNQQMGSGSPSSIGGQKTLMGTALGHLSEVADAAANLNNSDGLGVAALGQGINYARSLGTDQAAKINKLNESVDRFSGEVGKLYSGSAGGGVHERDQTRSRFGGTRTSAELAGALEASRDLIASKLAALEAQRDQVMGPGAKNIDFLGEKGKAALAQIDTAISRLKGTTSEPASAPAEGATATNQKTGAKIVFHSGQWVPMK